MHLRVYYRQVGGHVHCRVFSGPSKEKTHAKNGDLTFSEAEWHASVWDALVSIAEVVQEPPRVDTPDHHHGQ